VRHTTADTMAGRGLAHPFLIMIIVYLFISILQSVSPSLEDKPVDQLKISVTVHGVNSEELSHVGLHSSDSCHGIPQV
jgi:hypothetical protein